MKRASLALLALSVAGVLQAQLPMPNTTDPRVGLRAGFDNAGIAAANLRLVSTTAKPAMHAPRDPATGRVSLAGLTYANSDLAFRGNYVYQGNFSGFVIWDISNPSTPVMVNSYLCATGQGDPSIFGNLLFISAEGGSNRIDCGAEPVRDTVSKERFRGVRVFDVSNPRAPKPVSWIQSCRGSHTHTLVPDLKDKNIVYVYISGSQDVRSATEVPGCKEIHQDSAGSSRGRIEIARVPANNPSAARIVNGAQIFKELQRVSGHGASPADTLGRGGRGAGTGRAGGAGRGGRGAVDPNVPPTRGGPDQCHDITVYAEAGLAAGACGQYGILLDIKDPVNPKRMDFAADTNFAFWHSATFNNDGTKLLFTDEWGGGTAARCRALDPIPWGADAIFTIDKGKLKQGAYFKIPGAQTTAENCVAHNGNLIPVPGRDIFVQGWYQGGVSVLDFTDANKPVELAYFDRGPIDSTLVTAGSWGAYWYNGYVYSSEIARGLDILELTSSNLLSQNEIDAARSVKWEEHNPQSQPRIVWPATFSLPRAYLDQLERTNGLAADRIASVRREIDAAERLTGLPRRTALGRTATSLELAAARAGDAAKVRLVVKALRDLAK